VQQIVEATVSARRSLLTLLRTHTSLRRVHVHRWAGAGAVVYVPAIVDEQQTSTPDEWTEPQRRQISHLNIELVHSLRAADSAFSTGE
jgi:dienelactone hydrolase